jgi:hypothetical protein
VLKSHGLVLERLYKKDIAETPQQSDHVTAPEANSNSELQSSPDKKDIPNYDKEFLVEVDKMYNKMGHEIVRYSQILTSWTANF